MHSGSSNPNRGFELRNTDRLCEQYAEEVAQNRRPLPAGLARLPETMHYVQRRQALANQLRREGHAPYPEVALLVHMQDLCSFVSHVERRARLGTLAVVAPLLAPVHAACRDAWLPVVRRVAENNYELSSLGIVEQPVGLIAIAASVYWLACVRLRRLWLIDDAEQPAGTRRQRRSVPVWARLNRRIVDFSCARAIHAPPEAVENAARPRGPAVQAGPPKQVEAWRRMLPKARTVASEMASALLGVPLAAFEPIGNYTLGAVYSALRAIGGLFHDVGRHDDVEALFECVILRLGALLQGVDDGDVGDDDALHMRELAAFLDDGPCPVQQSRTLDAPLLTVACGKQRIVLLERLAALAEPWQLRCEGARRFDREAVHALCPLGPIPRTERGAMQRESNALAEARAHVDNWPPRRVVLALADGVKSACIDSLLSDNILEAIRDGAAGRLLRPGERQLHRALRTTEAERDLLLVLLDGESAGTSADGGGGGSGSVHEALIVDAALSSDRALGGVPHAEDVLEAVRTEAYQRRLQPVTKVGSHELLLAYAEEVHAAAVTLCYADDDDEDDDGPVALAYNTPAFRDAIHARYRDEEQRLYVEWAVCPHERMALLVLQATIDMVLTARCDPICSWRVCAALFADNQRDLKNYFPPTRPADFFVHDQRARARQRGPVMAVLVRDWYVVEWDGDNGDAENTRRRERGPAEAGDGDEEMTERAIAVRCWAFGPHPLVALGALLGVAARQGVLPLPAIRDVLRGLTSAQSVFFEPPFVFDPAATTGVPARPPGDRDGGEDSDGDESGR